MYKIEILFIWEDGTWTSEIIDYPGGVNPDHFANDAIMDMPLDLWKVRELVLRWYVPQKG